MAFCWQQAQHHLTRELGWCLFSPPIMTYSLPPAATGSRQTSPVHWHIPEDEEARHLLASVDQQPAMLEKFLNAREDRRLGARFEALWQFFLDKHSFYRVLATNLQISAGSRTLGSIDFLIEDSHLNLVIHLEVAVKFYLYLPAWIPQQSTLEKWLGPNPDDSLALKTHHFIHHQLPLSTHPEALAAIKARGLATPNIRVAIMKGYLFYPEASDAPTPAIINQEHPRGLWLYPGQLPALAATFPGATWKIVDKEQWLDPEPGATTPLAAVEGEIRALLDMRKQPLMLQGKMTANSTPTLPERIFVIPDGWPYRTNSQAAAVAAT
ncbi:MAG: DUF1853 family protein [Porticoccaceae bacterium]|nr:DUF1853 family protein [Porticoccaceae bacterium]